MAYFIGEVDSWNKGQNEHESKINWKFTQKIADEKMSKYYAL